MKRKIKPGALDEIAREIGAKSDRELAKFMGISVSDLENLRYGEGVSLLTAADILRRRESHLKAAELLEKIA